MTTLTTTRRDPSFERSHEQRLEALRRANEVRTARAAVKEQLRMRQLAFADLLNDPPACVRTARVLQMLLAVPGMGDAKATRVLRAHGISANKTVGGLSLRQRRALMEYFRRS